MAQFRIEHLTLGEIATVEDLSGQSLSEFGDDGVPMGKAMAALVMMAKRRNGEPGFKFNDALAVSMEEAQQLLGFTTLDRPDDDAPKAEWKEYAEATDLDVAGMTRAEIIAAVDAAETEVDSDPPPAA